MERTVLESKERQFWLGNADYYRQHLATDALMVFAEPVGVLDRDRIIASVAASARWTGVRFRDVRFIELGRGSVLMTYVAHAERQGNPNEYVALVSSAYILREGEWVLAFHQQTPCAAS